MIDILKQAQQIIDLGMRWSHQMAVVLEQDLLDTSLLWMLYFAKVVQGFFQTDGHLRGQDRWHQQCLGSRRRIWHPLATVRHTYPRQKLTPCTAGHSEVRCRLR